jgi:glycosyltransferase involved in cell wall biosynthesis
MKTPKVSVVMPVYNAERYLGEAIDSVLRQTFDDFELIMVNDCSKDGSWAIMQEYARRDPRIVLVHNAQNLGEAGARNAGAKQARGQYLAAMDADDINLVDRLALQVNFLDSNPDVGLVAGCAKRIDPEGNFLSMWTTPSEHEVLRAQLLFNNVLPHPTVTMRNTLFKQLGGYSSFFTTDYDLWWRFSKVSQLAALPQTLALIRIAPSDPNRISSGQAPKQLLYSQEMSLRIAKDIMGSRPLDEEAYKRFFLASRGKDNSLLRFDIRRLQSLWDFIVADPVYKAVATPKLVSIMTKIMRSQPVEAVSLLVLLRTQFGVPWKQITRKYVETYGRNPGTLIRRHHPPRNGKSQPQMV